MRFVGLGVEGLLAEVVEPTCAVIRSLKVYLRQSVGAKRAPTRACWRALLSHPLQSQTLVQEGADQSSDRNRRSSLTVLSILNDAESMRSSKRRLLDFDSPWEKQAWLRESVKDLTPPKASTTCRDQFITQRELPAVRRSHSKTINQLARYRPYTLKGRTPRGVLKDLHLCRTAPPPLEFMWANDDEQGRDADLKKEEQSLDQKNALVDDEVDLENHDSLPIGPLLPNEPTTPASEQENDTSDKESDNWDAEGDKEWRKFLRAQPDSYDDQGFKVVVDGTISPEIQDWNERHELKLLNQAAEQQQTHSVIPGHAPSHGPPRSVPRKSDTTEVSPSSIAKVMNGIRSFWKPAKSDIKTTRSLHRPIKEESSSPDPLHGDSEQDASTPTAENTSPREEQASPGAKVKVQQSDISNSEVEQPVKPQSVHKPPPLFDTAAKQFASLTLGPSTTPARHVRTPKATAHLSAKTDRKTRYQRLLEEREAARDAYKIVPLSAAWDARVRKAVADGLTVGRNVYTSTDLSRVVPQYSTKRGHDNWLNDAVINDYISLIVKHGNKDDRPTQPVPSHAAFSSHMWTKVSADPTSVPSSWARKQKISGKKVMECEKIFIPINSGAHWTLCVIQPKSRNISVYNSMGHRSNRFVAENFLAWVRHEVGSTFDEKEWTLNAGAESPQQTNSDDCGVFTVTTARQVMLGKMDSQKDRYTADLIPIQRKRVVAELINGGLLSAEESKGEPPATTT